MQLNLRLDDAMARVQGKAERLCPGWIAQAEALLIRFLYSAPAPFLTESFVQWAEDHGLPEPHDSRAYGPLMNRARRLGWIVRVGYRCDSTGAPKSEWRPA